VPGSKKGCIQGHIVLDIVVDMAKEAIVDLQVQVLVGVLQVLVVVWHLSRRRLSLNEVLCSHV